MMVRSISGDDAMNEFANAAFHAVIATLIKEGIMTPEQAKEFLDTHFCIIANSDGGLKNWLQRIFGNEEKNMVVCAKSDIRGYQ
jgi:polyhydroxyalkanoate synthesis regulator phasin